MSGGFLKDPASSLPVWINHLTSNVGSGFRTITACSAFSVRFGVPSFKKLIPGNTGANIHAMGMKICVVPFLVCVPAAKLVTLEKQELARRDLQFLCHSLDCNEKADQIWS